MKFINNKKCAIIASLCISIIVLSLVFSCKHESVHAVVTEYATCTQIGHENIICDKCNDILREQEIEAYGHTFRDYELTVAPSKNKNGVETKTCSACFATEEREYVCPHRNTKVVVEKAATCSENGLNAVVCAHCDTTTYTSPVSVLECVYGDWIVIEESTCTDSGYKQRTCVNCNEIDRADIELAECTRFSYSHSVINDAKMNMTNYYVCACGNTKQENEKLYSNFHCVLQIKSVGLRVNYSAIE